MEKTPNLQCDFKMIVIEKRHYHTFMYLQEKQQQVSAQQLATSIPKSQNWNGFGD